MNTTCFALLYFGSGFALAAFLGFLGILWLGRIHEKIWQKPSTLTEKLKEALKS